MRRIVYVATFEGSAAPTNEGGTELKVSTRATNLVPLAGSQLPQTASLGASFESIASIGADGKFGEAGAIDLGGGNTLRFRELAPGTMGPAPDGRNAGAIDWLVESGTGALEGASGYITSNFSVGEAGDVVDHQLASLVLP